MLSILSVLIVSSYVYLYVLPKGPEITEVRQIKEKADSFVMYAYKGKTKRSIRVWTYRPNTWRNGDEILFVMHGVKRNAKDYLNAWKAISQEENILVVAPEFSNKFSKYITNDYQEGNLFTYFGTKNPKDEWAFTVVENIFTHLKQVNLFKNETYDIFGHSAGGQFVHRMIMLFPENRIRTAIAANAGVYTYPNDKIEYPYGIKNISNVQLEKYFEKQLIIQLGELDNSSKSGRFIKTDLAMNQGRNRLERGSNFYNWSKKYSKRENHSFKWSIDTIENVGHDYKKMAKNAIKYLE